MSSSFIKPVQRDVFISFEGEEKILVHCQPLPNESILSSLDHLPKVKLEEGTLDEFCQRAHKIVQSVMQFKVCVGGNHMGSRDIWDNISDAYIDTNPYQEEGYAQTCRSVNCELLIPFGKKMRCTSCYFVMRSLQRRSQALQAEMIAPNAPNVHLSNKQKLAKLQAQAEELKRRAAKIAYLTKKNISNS